MSQATDLERIQKVGLKIILEFEYTIYSDALDMVCLDTLHDRRENRYLVFTKKSLKHTVHKRLFPINDNQATHSANIRNREPFIVNFSRIRNQQYHFARECQTPTT